MSAFTPIVASAPLAEAMGEELLLASRMLADLAYELGSDATTLRKHMTGLQKIDHITQIQLAIVDLLRNRGADGDPLAGVTLAEMADRLRAAMDRHAA